ncbi:MAG TPA: glycosyltransferase, partial [Candidatus Kapabacteria bacterium]
MDLSIVIVSYNVKDFLRGAIASVKRSLAAGGLDGEIIIVDNNSADGSVAMVRSEFPDVLLHALDANLGFGRANNIALREAKGDYMLLLNPDTILGEDTLSTMLAFLREHPEAGLAGCKLLNGDGTFQLSCRRGFPTPWASFTKLFGLARLFPNSKLFARYNLTFLPVDETYEVDALGGAFMMLSRPALEASHGFDEDFFMYGEDLDLCYRVKQSGFNVFYVPTTATVHFKGESTKRSAVNEVQLFYEAMHVFVKKHYRASFFFSALLRVGIMLRSALAVLRKYRSSVSLAGIDFLIVALSVLVGSQVQFNTWFGLPAEDYPFALILPSAMVVTLLAILRAYRPGGRATARPVLIAVPAILIGLSSLTYFFKEFPASRSFVIIVTCVMGAMLLLDRFGIAVLGRLARGTSLNPQRRRALIVGTDIEALRIAALLARRELLQRFEVVGMIDRSLDRLGAEVSAGLCIVGDTNMVGKVVREKRVAEVIFPSGSVSYTEVLAIMQRTSSENPSLRVNFSMVPAASDVLLGKQSIELLTETA